MFQPLILAIFAVLLLIILYSSTNGETKTFKNIKKVEIYTKNTNSTAIITDSDGIEHHLPLEHGSDLILRVNVGYVNAFYKNYDKK